MSKSPKDPREIFPEFIADYQALFGDDLVSIILYGSATGEGYRPGKSDINFMVVLSEKGMERLDLVFEKVKKWRKRNVATPLFLTEGYVETSLDVYPIEYFNFQRDHILVYGKDILKDLAFDNELLRLQCEREIKGKLMLLRDAFINSAGKGRALKELIGRSLLAFIAIFRALLYLKGKDIPRGKREIVKASTEAFDRDGAVFERLLDIREDKIKPDDGEILDLFKNYLKEIRELSKQVDELGGYHE